MLNRSLTFTPRTGGGYTVSSGTLDFDSSIGTNLNLGNDVSVQRSFTFPFFGVNQTSVFINSNGYVTFGNASSFVHFNGQSGGGVSTVGDASTVLDRIAEGFPRAGIIDDFSPVEQQDGDRRALIFIGAFLDECHSTLGTVPRFIEAATIGCASTTWTDVERDHDAWRRLSRGALSRIFEPIPDYHD